MNPELKRNLLIEFSVQRLVAMTVIIALLVIVIWSSDDVEGVVTSARGGFWAMILLWGTRKVANAFDSELVNNTWDGQRLSALSAFEIFIGKFFGAAAFVLYGAGLLLLVSVLGQVWQTFVMAQHGFSGVEGLPGTTIALFGIRDFLAAFLSLAVSMFVAIVLMRRERASKGISVTLCQIAGIAVAALYTIPVDIVSFGSSLASELGGAGLVEGSVGWYGLSFSHGVMVVWSLLVFAGFAVFGIVRALRGALQFRSRRWGWALFVVVFACYLAGFDVFYVVASQPSEWLFVFFLIVWAIAVMLTYLVVFIEAKPLREYRMFKEAFGSGHLLRAWEYIPFWLITLIVVFLSLLCLTVFGESISGRENSVLADDASQLLFQALSFSGTSIFVSASLFLLRDCLLVLALNFGRRPVRSDLAALIYLAVLYAVLPLLLRSLGMGDTFAMAVFVPTGSSIALVPVLLQVAAVGGFVIWRWKKIAGSTAPV